MGYNSKIIQTKVKVLAFCTSPDNALYLYKVMRVPHTVFKLQSGHKTKSQDSKGCTCNSKNIYIERYGSCTPHVA